MRLMKKASKNTDSVEKIVNNKKGQKKTNNKKGQVKVIKIGTKVFEINNK